MIYGSHKWEFFIQLLITPFRQPRLGNPVWAKRGSRYLYLLNIDIF